MDSINLHNGFGSTTLLSSPPLYAINVFGIILLFKFGVCSPSYQCKLSLDDKHFENKLKNFISSEVMVSSIASLIHLYKQNPYRNHKLTSFMAIFMSKIHFMLALLLILNIVLFQHVIHFIIIIIHSQIL